ncbi:MAG: hypothetical protein JRG96_19735 [Deltaproteobacteria bacterium]|nr:hypothetical protein [Deltaproteobacteria bacterium]MBW2419128.1 hypothetical protein [Deltaproteobacteria bacterium]
MAEPDLDAALPLIAWSRIWSPVVPEELQSEAWEALGLPGSFEGNKTGLWSLFHLGTPQPRVPLLLHAALGREGAAVREDWLRVISYLELAWDEVHLPPDQLGVACEIYACAVQSREPVLIEALRERYLLPWCAFASEELALQGSSLVFLPEHFEADLRACG